MTQTFYAHLPDVPSRTIDQAYADKSAPSLMTVKEMEAAFAGLPQPEAHSHYFKKCPYDQIDVYRVLEIFGVTCPVMQHVVKKALNAGQRGHKNQRRDVQDIADSAKRKLAMLDEDKVICGELK